MTGLTIIPNSPVPAYRQIYDGIASGIISGRIAGGSPLPPIRTVAKELGVSVITVRSAWDALEADGLIVTRAGSGCYAAELTSFELERMRLKALEKPLRELISSAKQLGMSVDELIETVKKGCIAQ